LVAVDEKPRELLFGAGAVAVAVDEKPRELLFGAGAVVVAVDEKPRARLSGTGAALLESTPRMSTWARAGIAKTKVSKREKNAVRDLGCKLGENIKDTCQKLLPVILIPDPWFLIPNK
jgi:hypothetical protein